MYPDTRAEAITSMAQEPTMAIFYLQYCRDVLFTVTREIESISSIGEGTGFYRMMGGVARTDVKPQISGISR